MDMQTVRSDNLNRWYEEKLHLHRNAEGDFIEAQFKNKSAHDAGMLSIQVEKLAPLIITLAEQGVRILDYIDETPRGKFAWIYDPEGNKIELWEASDESSNLIDLPEPD